MPSLRSVKQMKCRLSALCLLPSVRRWQSAPCRPNTLEAPNCHGPPTLNDIGPVLQEEGRGVSWSP